MANSPPPIREPQLLRFRLRQMFLSVTLLSVFCALMVATEGHWPMVISVITLLVGAHVFSTVVGTRLRDTSADVQRWRSAKPGLNDDFPQASLTVDETTQLELPPTTPLADRGFSNRWLFWFVTGGALLSAVIGGVVLHLAIGSRIGWAGWAVGTFSCTVLGTWLAFLASSFSSIARHAWRHAHEKGQ